MLALSLLLLEALEAVRDDHDAQASLVDCEKGLERGPGAAAAVGGDVGYSEKGNA